MIAERQDRPSIAHLVQFLARQPPSTDRLKTTALQSLTDSLRENIRPEWNSRLRSSLTALLEGSDQNLVNAVLPLIARWDLDGKLTSALRPTLRGLIDRLSVADLTEDARSQVATTLLGVRRYDSTILPAVGELLSADTSPQTKANVVDALGAISDPAAGNELVGRFADLPSDLQQVAFGHIGRRVDWTQGLIDALEEGVIPLPLLGPGNVHRLKTHSNASVSKRALAVIEVIRGPEESEKNQLIAGFAEIVEQPGNLANGKTLFEQNCGVCHKFNGEGNDLALDLTGMGTHGPHDLLVHILDPNRLVEPNFVSTSVLTMDDEVIEGIVESENQNVPALRNATGRFDVQQKNIFSRRSTGMSLMPTGYEALGGEGLRDLIAYLCEGEGQFRVLNLGTAFTANSSQGIYRARTSSRETLRFKQFGLVRVDGIPFEIVNPIKSQTGNNVIVLKGGEGYAKTMPQVVECQVGVAAKTIHVLGAVGGWAWPWGGDRLKDEPVSKLTLHFANGYTEEKTFKNGIEFADYNGRAEVPGSQEAVEIVRYGQVRWFSVDVTHPAVIEKITLESFDNEVAPTYVALTAETR